MNELSLHIYDIVQNSVRASADTVWINILEDDFANEFKIIIRDNGTGMSEEVMSKVRDPFFTSRKTRSVGLGISLFELAANQANGFLSMETELGVGTKLTVVFEKDNINRNPLGEIAETIYLLSLNEVNIKYHHKINSKSFEFNKSDLVEILGDIPLTNIEVKSWIEEYIKENIINISGDTNIKE